MIDRIHKFWNIKPEYIFADEFTGYEDLYPELDSFTSEVYEADPQTTWELDDNGWDGELLGVAV